MAEITERLTIITDPNLPTIARPDVTQEPSYLGTSLGDLVAHVTQLRAKLPPEQRGCVVFMANGKGVELIAKATNQAVPALPPGRGIRINQYRGMSVNINGQFHPDQKEVFRVCLLNVVPKGPKVTKVT